MYEIHLESKFRNAKQIEVDISFFRSVKIVCRSLVSPTKSYRFAFQNIPV